MTVLKDFTKPPAGRLPYGIDWKDNLAPGETITKSVWNITPPPGFTVLGTYIVGAQCVIWVEGGSAGCVYTLTNTIETTLCDPSTGKPRVDERSIRIFVRPR